MSTVNEIKVCRFCETEFKASAPGYVCSICGAPKWASVLFEKAEAMEVGMEVIEERVVQKTALYDLYLTSSVTNKVAKISSIATPKIAIIKVIRQHTGCGLREAKQFVDESDRAESPRLLVGVSDQWSQTIIDAVNTKLQSEAVYRINSSTSALDGDKETADGDTGFEPSVDFGRFGMLD